MDDINIASTIQGQYNGLAQQADARARAGYYNSLSDINRQNMPIQAQDAANRNALSQQAIQNGQNTLDESQNQRDTGNAFANMIAQSHKATPAEPPVAPQTQSAPITSAGPLAVPSAPRAIVPQPQSLSSLMANPNALTANQSQVLQSPIPQATQSNYQAQYQGGQPRTQPQSVTKNDIDPSLISKGLLEPGNINLRGRPLISMSNGQVGSEYSVSFTQDGKEVLVPTIFDGKSHTPQEAWQHYLQTGQHMGKYDNPEDADAAAELIHQREYAVGGSMAQTKQAIAQSQGSTPTLTPLADHPAVQNFLASTPNTNPDTKKAVDPDNPTFAAQHTFDSVDPKTGAVIHNTFDRQSLIDQMMNYTDKNGNHVMAGDANKLMSQFTLSDAADEKAKQDKIAAGHAQALMLSAGLEYLPADQQAAVYQGLKSRAAQAGADTSTWPTGPTDPNFKPWVAQQGEEARMNANTAKEASKRAEDAFNDLKARAEAQRDLSQGVESQAKAGTEPSIQNKNNAEAFKAYEEGKVARSAGGPVDPAVVQAYVDGHMSVTPMTFRTAYGQNLFKSIMAVDPTWTETRAQTRKNMTTGPVGKTADALNTAPVHIDDWVTAMQAQQNGSFVPGNAIYNKWAGILGSDKPVTTNAIKDAVSDEIAGSLKQSGATDTSIKAQQENFKNAASPQQAMAVGKSAMGVLRDKLNIYQEKYQRDNPTDTGFNLIQPTTAAIFNKYGVVPNPGGLAQTTTPGQPAGTNHPAAPQMRDGTVSASGKYVWHGGWVAR